MYHSSHLADLIHRTSNNTSRNLHHLLRGCDFTSRLHPIRNNGNATIHRSIWVSELHSRVNRLFFGLVTELPTSKTFPVREMFSRIQTSAMWTTDSSPEDFGDVVAVIEEVLVKDERWSEIMWWDTEGWRCGDWCSTKESGNVRQVSGWFVINLISANVMGRATFQNDKQESFKHIHPC
jgi:hypothetical protein